MLRFTMPIAMSLTMVLTSCTASPSSKARDPITAPKSRSSATPNTRCGHATINRNSLPSWTASANPPANIPFVVSKEKNVAAVLFGNPLRGGARDVGGNNKILWIVRQPRNGKPLHITAQLEAGGGQAISLTRPADASPGEIYPSIVNVPSPGCWRMNLAWAGQRATLDLYYKP